MKPYDPDKTVDPDKWTALDEGERLYLVEHYHRKNRIRMPNLPAHAVFHVTVENQVALGGKIPVQKTLLRLMGEGLSRHDAVHAIGSILAGQIYNLMKHGAKNEDVNADYYRRLEKLTAESWLRSIDEESEDED